MTAPTDPLPPLGRLEIPRRLPCLPETPLLLLPAAARFCRPLQLPLPTLCPLLLRPEHLLLPWVQCLHLQASSMPSGASVVGMTSAVLPPRLEFTKQGLLPPLLCSLIAGLSMLPPFWVSWSVVIGRYRSFPPSVACWPRWRGSWRTPRSEGRTRLSSSSSTFFWPRPPLNPLWRYSPIWAVFLVSSSNPWQSFSTPPSLAASTSPGRWPPYGSCWFKSTSLFSFLSLLFLLLGFLLLLAFLGLFSFFGTLLFLLWAAWTCFLNCLYFHGWLGLRGCRQPRSLLWRSSLIANPPRPFVSLARVQIGVGNLQCTVIGSSQLRCHKPDPSRRKSIRHHKVLQSEDQAAELAAQVTYQRTEFAYAIEATETGISHQLDPRLQEKGNYMHHLYSRGRRNIYIYILKLPIIIIYIYIYNIYIYT